ncbi:hypothetical protein HK099_006069 [Clydaea vesicula]|uniref:Uncharacterized protein n=1 Tax=Clydaea vesicula TaxID=447962 RepID=A0AAD5XY91_9FUNG|nr:hypothetical protein HK099_006069 [Clydaea vesicula]KAJ3397109.1 hypothetical protein HDU92_000809 [Lobulomyces angularis]
MATAKELVPSPDSLKMNWEASKNKDFMERKSYKKFSSSTTSQKQKEKEYSPSLFIKKNTKNCANKYESISNLRDKSCVQEMLNRNQNLVDNKTFMNSLSDKGAKLLKKNEELRSILDKILKYEKEVVLFDDLEKNFRKVTIKDNKISSKQENSTIKKEGKIKVIPLEESIKLQNARQAEIRNFFFNSKSLVAQNNQNHSQSSFEFIERSNYKELMKEGKGFEKYRNINDSSTEDEDDDEWEEDGYDDDLIEEEWESDEVIVVEGTVKS